MSAWYVFAAIGLFPQSPGRAELLLGSPVFTRVMVARSNGVRMTITGNTTGTYVHRVHVNGSVWRASWLPESFLQRGGTVAFTLGDVPDTTWATAARDLPVDHR
jgi:putative alpha-1,2-mannosidase